MKYYAVIDTNVLVSAMLKWDSVPGTVVDLAFEGFIVPLLNSEIVKEYREVLSRPKFHLTEEIVEAVIGSIEKQGTYLNAEKLDIDLPDPKDLVFYEVTMKKRQSENAYLVTGNIKHFPVEPFIVTPHEMLEIILADQTEN